MMQNGDMGWWMVWGSVMMVVFWVAVIALVAWVVQSLVRRDHTAHGSGGNVTAPGPRLEPLDVAKERYARGEISRDEFEQIRDALSR
jgi:putative membrane protein